MKGILGRKVGMTQVFTTNGKLIPVTVVSVEPNIVTQIKTTDKDGYNAIQMGAFDKKVKASNKPEMGHVKNAKTEPKRFLKELRGVDISLYQVGQELKPDLFEPGDIIDVTGTSKGKGFQGVIKRHGYSRGPETHGSHHHRRPGSLGTMLPKRVLKGKKLPGHMGNEQVTIQNLYVVDVDLKNNYLLVSGNIPGPKGSLVLIKTSIKKGDQKVPVELFSYNETDTEVTESKDNESNTEKQVTEKTEESKKEEIEEQKETPKDKEEK